MDASEAGERFVPGHDGPAIHVEHLHRYAMAQEILRGAVLDVGCGVGYGTRLLRRRTAPVTGIDRSPTAVAYARARFGAPGLDYVVADARALPFGAARFDGIVCFEVLEHLREQGEVLCELRRVLAPAGLLVLSTPNRPVYSEGRGYRNPHHQRELDAAELAALLGEHFAEVVVLSQRLVAGSLVWRPASPEHSGELLRLSGADELPATLRCDPNPMYLIAVCAAEVGMAGQRLAGTSFLPVRLEAFLEEEADMARLHEGRTRARYEAVVADLRGRLAEFDARIRRLGREVEQVQAARAGEAAALGERLGAAEREREETRRAAEAAAGRAERARAELAARTRRIKGAARRLLGRERAAIANLRRQMASLQRQVAALERETAAAIGEREALVARLAGIEGSRVGRQFVRGWRAYRALRHVVVVGHAGARAALSRLRPIARPPAGAVGAPPSLARLLAVPYLLAFTAGVQLAAWSRRRRRRAAPAARAPARDRSARRPRVLLISPYPIHPPHHGGGVRISNLVRRIAAEVDLYLLVFIRGDDDPPQREALAPFAREVVFQRWEPVLAADRRGLMPPAARLFSSPAAAARVAEMLSSRGIDILQLEYTELGQYGLPLFARVKVVLSEIDVTFRSRWRRRAIGLHRRFPEDGAFGGSFADWMRQLRYELAVARRADQVHVMSEADAEYLAAYLPASKRGSIRVVPNGVDTEFYRPPAEDAERQRERLLFVGNFQHLPNADALDFWLEEVWPLVRARASRAELTVVGANCPPRVLAYDGLDGVTVVGPAPDMSPYYRGHRALVAPLRAGSGTRLKILEAMACGLPVVSTGLGAEGIACTGGENILVAESPAPLAEAVLALLADDGLCSRLAAAARRLVEERYDWEASAQALLAGYAELLAGASPVAAPPRRVRPGSDAASEPDISVIIPTRNGGRRLRHALEAVLAQEIDRRFEVLCIDSGSSEEELEDLRRLPVRLERIPSEQFDHGLTRDLGAELSGGSILVFLNQDAVPCDRTWLRRLTAPLAVEGNVAAVQGGIHESGEPQERFYWDSGGDRFYFTRESRRWIEAHFGIGFSTVNAAIRRSVWTEHRFGRAPIMEDKKWQREVVEAGHAILATPDAAVFHSHDYDVRSLVRRCASEGYGWRLLGQRYSTFDLLCDLARPQVYADLLRGIARGKVRSAAELLFPWLRPLVLHYGNHWARGVKL